MSYLRPSSDVDLVSPVIACLVAVYGAEFGRGAWAEMDPLLMIRPPRGVWSFISLIASCVHRNTPVRLMSTTFFHCSNVRSSMLIGGAPDAGIVEQDVEAAERGLGLREECAHRFRIGDVGGDDERVVRVAPASCTAFSSSSCRRPASATL